MGISEGDRFSHVSITLVKDSEAGAFRARTLVDVVGVIKTTDSGKTVVRALVPAWDMDHPVEWSSDVFPQELRDHLEPGSMYVVEVDLGAQDPDGLSPKNFEPAPPPIENPTL